jgi:hypothetical protein
MAQRFALWPKHVSGVARPRNIRGRFLRDARTTTSIADVKSSLPETGAVIQKGMLFGV